MYYLFDNSVCVATSDKPIEPIEGLTLIESDEDYTPWEIELVDGEIQKKVIEEPPPEEPTVVVEDKPEPITIDNVALLELIAEICEDIDELKERM